MAYEPIPFYRVQLQPTLIEDSREYRLLTAAVMDCSLCGEVINGMGGGGVCLCRRCGDALESGQLRGHLKWIDEEQVHEQEDDGA